MSTQNPGTRSGADTGWAGGGGHTGVKKQLSSCDGKVVMVMGLQHMWVKQQSVYTIATVKGWRGQISFSALSNTAIHIYWAVTAEGVGDCVSLLDSLFGYAAG